MAFTGADIMRVVAKQLGDTTNVRWPLTELADWINEGALAIVLAKPSASAKTRIMELQAGTLQIVPTGEEDEQPVPLALLNVIRNLKTTATDPRVGGRVVRPTTRGLLDVNDPSWHDSTATPYRKEVRQFVFDELNPLEFYVYPGNDGTGIVEILVSLTPLVLAPLPDTNPQDYEAWESPIGLAEPYSVPLKDYVLYRCQSKDDETGNAGRAAGHYQMFANALGIKGNVDTMVDRRQKTT